jgi:hypothetical protein
MIDRQIGRNAELFAQSIAEIDSKAAVPQQSGADDGACL